MFLNVKNEEPSFISSIFKPAFPPFSLFPGEVLPYFLLHFRPKVNNETVFISFILLSLFSFIYLIYQPSMTWVIDFFEVFFIIIFVLNFKEFFPLKFFKSNIRIFSVLFFILGIIDFYVFNNFLTSYISEAPSSDVLSDFNRGQVSLPLNHRILESFQQAWHFSV